MTPGPDTVAWPARIVAALTEVLGAEVEVADGFGPVSVVVPVAVWSAAVRAARDSLGCTYFDWLSAIDELAEGFSVVIHLAALSPGRIDHLLLRTKVPRAAPELASVTDVFAGAAWHERETYEMFGITFAGHPGLDPLLLPDEFEGHPLRKEFVLASRVAKPWPGAKEPGESDAPGESGGSAGSGAPGRRRNLPPGVPDTESWGPRPPGSPAPDPLAAAQSTAGGRPRRTPRRQSPDRSDAARSDAGRSDAGPK